MTQTDTLITGQGSETNETLHQLNEGDFCMYLGDNGTCIILVTSATPYMGDERYFFGGEIIPGNTTLELLSLHSCENSRITQKAGGIDINLTRKLVQDYYSKNKARNYNASDVI